MRTLARPSCLCVCADDFWILLRRESIEGGDWLRALQHSSSLSASAPSPQQHPQPQPQSLAQPLSLTPTTIKVA